MEGVEPPWVSPLEPKSSASTNFATLAKIRRFGSAERAAAVLKNVGGPSRARTWDPLIKSQLLYQLS